MTMSLLKKMKAFLLLVAVFLLPLNTFAHEVISGTSKETCACQLLPISCCTDDNGEQSDHYPGNDADNCCDSEECCPDATEPPIVFNLKVNFAEKQLFQQNSNKHTHEVYLAIFVPPES